MLISIITPAEKDDDKLIRLTAESLIANRHPDAEYIVMDGGLQGKTITFIRKCYPSVRIIPMAFDNPYEAMNAGIDLASGEYVMFLMPGTFCPSNSIDNIATELAVGNNETDILGGSLIVNSQTMRPAFFPNFFFFTRFFLQAALIHKRVFEICGQFSPNYHTCADLAFALTTWEQGVQVVHAREIFAELPPYRLSKRETSAISLEIRKVLLDHGFSEIYADILYMMIRWNLRRRLLIHPVKR